MLLHYCIFLFFDFILSLKDSVKLSDGATSQDIITGRQVKYFHYDLKANSDVLYITLNMCDLSNGNSALDLYYTIKDEPDNVLDGWNRIGIHKTISTYDSTFIRFSKSALEDYLFGIRRDNITIENQNSKKVYFAVKLNDPDQSKIDFEVTLSTREYINNVDNTIVGLFSDSDHNSASVIINNKHIKHLSREDDIYNMYYFKFEPSRRLNTMCYLNYKKRSIVLSGDKGKLLQNIKVAETTDQIDDVETIYGAYFLKLEENTEYVTYFVNNRNKHTYPPIYFQTKKKSQQCYLATNFKFCDEISYSIPVPDVEDGKSSQESYIEERIRINKAVQIYDKKAEDIYSNFTDLINQYNCDNNRKRYSPVRGCDDCKRAYKNWICGITIPRCTDSVFDSKSVIRRNKEDKIKPFVYDELGINEFNELKPCAELCHHVMQSCPASFKFTCPKASNTLESSYFKGTDNESGSIFKQIEIDIGQFYSSHFSNETTIPNLYQNPKCNILVGDLNELYLNPHISSGQLYHFDFINLIILLLVFISSIPVTRKEVIKDENLMGNFIGNSIPVNDSPATSDGFMPPLFTQKDKLTKQQEADPNPDQDNTPKFVFKPKF
ncbi:hypothetical protein K502DRAFT_363933 [Neoconidiobolus thromboides FSU 785]|nr:hypothetical protein K502DRAFT_363933 [Neoconidiobolus thromboides FSU 785]